MNRKTCCTHLLCTLLLLPISALAQTEDADYFSMAVCESLDNINQKMQFTDESEKQKFFAYRAEIQSFLKNAPNFLEEKKQSNDMASVALACALIDDATNAFTKACLTDEGANIDITSVKNICENIDW